MVRMFVWTYRTDMSDSIRPEFQFSGNPAAHHIARSFEGYLCRFVYNSLDLKPIINVEVERDIIEIYVDLLLLFFFKLNLNS